MVTFTIHLHTEFCTPVTNIDINIDFTQSQCCFTFYKNKRLQRKLHNVESLFTARSFTGLRLVALVSQLLDMYRGLPCWCNGRDVIKSYEGEGILVTWCLYHVSRKYLSVESSGGNRTRRAHAHTHGLVISLHVKESGLK